MEVNTASAGTSVTSVHSSFTPLKLPAALSASCANTCQDRMVIAAEMCYTLDAHMILPRSSFCTRCVERGAFLTLNTARDFARPISMERVSSHSPSASTCWPTSENVRQRVREGPRQATPA